MSLRPASIVDAVPIPGPWTEQALCAQADPDVMCPQHQSQIARAKRICAACPVQAQCLAYALTGADTWRGITTGIWGGTTPRARTQLRQARNGAAA